MLMGLLLVGFKLTDFHSKPRKSEHGFRMSIVLQNLKVQHSNPHVHPKPDLRKHLFPNRLLDSIPSSWHLEATIS